MDKGPYHVVRVLLLQTIITGKVWVWFFFFVDYFFLGGGGAVLHCFCLWLPDFALCILILCTAKSYMITVPLTLVSIYFGY